MYMRIAMHEALATVTVISCEHTYIDVCTYVRVRACVRTCVCVWACVRACVNVVYSYMCAPYLLGNRYIPYVFLRLHSLTIC